MTDPAATWAFYGRRAELTQLRAILDRNRLLEKPGFLVLPKWTLKSPDAPAGGLISMFPKETFPKSTSVMPGTVVVMETGASSTRATGAALRMPRQAEDRSAKMGFMAAMDYDYLRVAASSVFNLSN